MSTPPSKLHPAGEDQETLAGRAICLRILNDMILQLGKRYGVSAVVLALTEIVGCQSCVSDKANGDSLRGLLERMDLAHSAGVLEADSDV
jgi:hypothetical protein